jgi:hypothetical protein
MLPHGDRCHHGAVHKYRPLTIALVWVLTVAGASTLTWAVISAAGTQVGNTTITTVSGQATDTDTDAASTTPSASASASAKSSGTAKATNKTTASSSQPVINVASWSGTGGKVTAKCTNSKISLVSAVPDLGYRVDRDDDKDGDTLKLEFKPTTEAGDEVSLMISCQTQHPVFTKDK